MRVAIAGAGDLAKYLVEELLVAGHSIVMFSRSRKAWFLRPNVVFHETDYSVPNLVANLLDCDAVVSTILDYTSCGIGAHLNILTACQQTARCKKFIPSEYGGNTDQFPEQPYFYEPTHAPIRDALKAQNDVMWTLLGNGWLMDYFVPVGQRYIRDIGRYHPIDFDKSTAIIPGTGDEPICFTSARDIAKAVVELISHDKWEESTFVSGDLLSWNRILQKLACRGRTFDVTYRPHAQLEEDSKGEGEDALVAQFGVWSSSGSCELPSDKVEIHRKKYFSQVNFRTLDEFLDEADRNPEIIM
jgi:nucleoside-diphosphate-sugar epimerase